MGSGTSIQHNHLVVSSLIIKEPIIPSVSRIDNQYYQSIVSSTNNHFYILHVFLWVSAYYDLSLVSSIFMQNHIIYLLGSLGSFLILMSRLFHWQSNMMVLFFSVYWKTFITISVFSRRNSSKIESFIWFLDELLSWTVFCVIDNHPSSYQWSGSVEGHPSWSIVCCIDNQSWSIQSNDFMDRHPWWSVVCFVANHPRSYQSSVFFLRVHQSWLIVCSIDNRIWS